MAGYTKWNGLRHTPRRVEGRGRLEHDPDHLPSFIECADIIGCCLVLAPMTLILLTVAQQVAMQLPDMVLGNRNVCPGLKNGFHDLGIARDLLLVSAGERLDLQQSRNCSTSRSVSLLPSIRVEEPMLSIVATRRSAFRRSGASVPSAPERP